MEVCFAPWLFQLLFDNIVFVQLIKLINPRNIDILLFLINNLLVLIKIKYLHFFVQIAATLSIPLWQILLVRLGKKTTIYIGLTVRLSSLIIYELVLPFFCFFSVSYSCFFWFVGFWFVFDCFHIWGQHILKLNQYFYVLLLLYRFTFLLSSPYPV